MSMKSENITKFYRRILYLHFIW